MQFQWDETKRQDVLRTRGVDLLYAALIFEGPVLTAPDTRGQYGEAREISIGVVDGECFVVVHTMRDGDVRLITAWKAGRKVHERYAKSLLG